MREPLRFGGWHLRSSSVLRLDRQCVVVVLKANAVLSSYKKACRHLMTTGSFTQRLLNTTETQRY
jgi:hypothetical protein